MSGNGDHKPKPKKMKGVFHKTKGYRDTCKGCGKGFHKFRWNAHHIIPADAFADANRIAKNVLHATTFDINKKDWLAGLPKLTAFILWGQDDAEMPNMTDLRRKNEKTVTMKRWDHVQRYKREAKVKPTFPGDFPVHNPTNWGHVQYDKDVKARLDDEIFSKCKKKNGKPEHPPLKVVKSELIKARDHFWKQLQDIPTAGHDGAASGGIKPNLRKRYGEARDGWWKPMCMVWDAPEPQSPTPP